MLLTARLLNNVVDVNHWEVVSSLESVHGDTSDIYFQLVDGSTDKSYNPPFRRYIPQVGAAVIVTFEDIDCRCSVRAFATQPFVADDRSIWKVTHDPIGGVNLAGLLGTYGMKLMLVEGTKVKVGFVSQALSVHRASPEF